MIDPQNGRRAEAIEDAIAGHGFEGYTKPFVWMARLFAPLVDRVIPMQRMNRQESRVAMGLYVILLPVVLVAFVLALPVDLWRGMRSKRHNAESASKLRAGADVVIGYRITHESRTRFEGTAGFDGEELAWLTVHRSPLPRPEGGAAEYLDWETNDPYGVHVRSYSA